MRASVHTAPDAHFAVDNKSKGVGKALSRENRCRKFTFLAAALVVGSSTQLCWGAANDSVVGLLAATQSATTGQAASGGGAKKPPGNKAHEISARKLTEKNRIRLKKVALRLILVDLTFLSGLHSLYIGIRNL